MILDFKTRGQLYSSAFEGIDKERFIRIVDGNANDTDRLFISNLLVKIKLDLRKQFIKLESYTAKYNSIKFLGELNDCSTETLDYINALKEAIQVTEECIIARGSLISNSICYMLDEHFTPKELIQIIGGDFETCNNIIKEFNEGDRIVSNPKSGLTLSLIIHHGEYRWRRGLSKDFIDCHKWEMPLFFATSEYMIKSLEDAPMSVKDEVFNKFDEMLADIKKQNAPGVKGKEGNLITVKF